jgi:hypothetical protein
MPVNRRIPGEPDSDAFPYGDRYIEIIAKRGAIERGFGWYPTMLKFLFVVSLIYSDLMCPTAILAFPELGCDEDSGCEMST